MDGVENTAAIILQSEKMQKIMKSMYNYIFFYDREVYFFIPG